MIAKRMIAVMIICIIMMTFVPASLCFAATKEGWISGQYYRNGEIVYEEWVKYKGKWYFLDEDGYKATKSVVTSDYKSFYGVDKKGVLIQKKGWYYLEHQVLDNYSYAWFYLDNTGKACRGWKKINKKWYYFFSNGAMCTDLREIDGKKYYFGSDGAMKTKWVQIERRYSVGKDWYYFNASGEMLTGWKKINKKWYYFDENGIMLQNTSREIEGKVYEFDGSGAMK